MKNTRPLNNTEICRVSAAFTGPFGIRNRGLFMLRYLPYLFNLFWQRYLVKLNFGQFSRDGQPIPYARDIALRWSAGAFL